VALIKPLIPFCLRFTVTEPMLHDSKHDLLRLRVSGTEPANETAHFLPIHTGNRCESPAFFVLPGQVMRLPAEDSERGCVRRQI
jgi:hypothetical protein